MSEGTQLKAYKCAFDGTIWCSLVFAKTARRARYLMAARWASDLEIDPITAYRDCVAVELPEMQHVTCGEPRILCQYSGSAHDAYLLGLSRIHMCPKCYREYDESGECWCDE